MVIRLDMRDAAPELVRIRVSPLAELEACLHVMAEPSHHRESRAWLAELAELMPAPLVLQLREFSPLWQRYRARFLYPMAVSQRSDVTLEDELRDVAALAADVFVPLAANAILGRGETWASADEVLASDGWRAACRARSDARGHLAERLTDDPTGFQADVVALLRRCDEAFYASLWEGTRGILQQAAARLESRLELAGVLDTVASVSLTSTADPATRSVRFDKLQSASRAVDAAGLILVPSMRSWPHTTLKLDAGLPVVVHFPVAEISPRDSLTPSQILSRVSLLAEPGRWDLCRHLLNEPMTTTELARRTGQSASSISRHLTRLRGAGLVTSIKDGRHVYHRMEPSVITRLGDDLLRALLR